MSPSRRPFLCRLGLHRWYGPNVAQWYRSCQRCGVESGE